MLSALLASPAFSQTMDFPQRFVSSDDNGVDVVTGQPVFSRTEGSIGVGADALVMQRVWSGTGWQDNLAGKLNRTTVSGVRKVTLALGLQSLTFTKVGSTFEPDNGDGSSLVEAADGKSYTFTTSGGTIYYYSSPSFATPDPDQTLRICTDAVDTSCILLPLTRTSADGARLTYEWNVYDDCYYSWKFERDVCKNHVRLDRVSDNAGLEMLLGYQSGAATGSAAWYRKTSVQFKRVADSAPATTLNYSYPDSLTTDVTDPDGGTSVYKIDSSSRLKSIQLPTETTPGLVYSYNSGGVVSQAVNAGVTRNYAWSTDTSGNTVVTTSGDAVSTIVSNPTIGRTVKETDADGNFVTNEYDYKQRLIRTTYPEGNKVEHGYDDRGNEVETRIKAKPGSGLPDLVSTAGYPATCTNTKTCNKPMWVEDAAGNRTDFTYDPTHGELIKEEKPAPTTGAARPTTITEHTAFTATGATQSKYLPTKVRRCPTAAQCAGSAAEMVTTTTYTSGNLYPATITTAAGDGSITATTTYGYTASGKVSTIDGPLSGTADTTYLFYTSGNRPLGVVLPDPDGGGPLPRRMERYTYNVNGQRQGTGIGTTTTVTSLTGFTILQERWTSYDAANRKVRDALYDGAYSSTKTPLSVTQYSYDSAGRLDCTAVRMNPAVFGSLPTSACIASTQGAAGPDRIAKVTYDANGKLASSTVGFGTAAAATEEMDYTANGKVAWVEDAKNNRTAYSYDGYDRAIKAKYPVTTVGAQSASTTDYEDFGYDVRGLLTSVRDRAGGNHTLSYDALGRMTSKTSPNSEPTRTMVYDLVDRLTSVQLAGDSVAHSFTYDALGRALTAVNATGSIGYQYNQAGQRTRMTWPDGLYVAYDYDDAGAMTKVRENGATSGIGVLATMAYDGLGRRTSLTLGNGAVQSYTYNSASQLETIGHNLSGTMNDVTATYAYNSAGQISSNTQSTNAYAWAPTTANTPYTANGLNQYLTEGSATLTYDSRGNLSSLTSAGVTKTYAYSSENMLTSASGNVTLAYDPLGRLREVLSANSTNRFLYDGLDLIGEYDSLGSMTRRYVHGPLIDEPLVWYEGGSTTDRRFLIADERGSIVAITNASGGLLTTNKYDEFGMPATNNLGRFQYTGQTSLPELGVYYFKARMYSPNLGRFMQTDPVGYADGMNWFDYVGGDPVNNIDPFGSMRITLSGANGITCEFRIDDSTGKVLERNCSVDIVVIAPLFDYMKAQFTRDALERGGRAAIEKAKAIYCSLPALGISGSASGYYGLGGGIAVSLAFDPKSGRLGVSGGLNVGVGIGMSVDGSASMTAGGSIAQGWSGSVGANAGARVASVRVGAQGTAISSDRRGFKPTFGGISGGYSPGTGATINANLAARGGYGAKVAPSCP